MWFLCKIVFQVLTETMRNTYNSLPFHPTPKSWQKPSLFSPNLYTRTSKLIHSELGTKNMAMAVDGVLMELLGR